MRVSVPEGHHSHAQKSRTSGEGMGFSWKEYFRDDASHNHINDSKNNPSYSYLKDRILRSPSSSKASEKPPWIQRELQKGGLRPPVISIQLTYPELCVERK
eukprot:c41151_g1_i1 orf=259-561(-)